MPPDAFDPSGPHPSTFSIVGFDPATGDVGVAVASKFLAVGAVVPWAEAGVGAIATQSYANTSYGPRGLILLRDGWAPEEAARRLLEEDPERESRQVGMVDARGRPYSFTGKQCIAWAGSLVGPSFAVQGNILVGGETLEAMAQAYQEAKGELAERLLAALEAGEAAGGDSRGRQSAALLVARKGGGYGGFSGRYMDLRVDDHSTPVAELGRLLSLQLGKDPLSLAHKREHQGHREQAIGIVEEGLRRNPDWDVLRFELARLLLLHGKTAEGTKELEAAVARGSSVAQYHYQASQVLAEAGLSEPCLREVGTALRLNPQYAELYRREISGPVSSLRRLKGEIEKVLDAAATVPGGSQEPSASLPSARP